MRINLIKKSPWIYIISSGSCNGCEITCVNCITPAYDIERLGCLLKPSPRHADIILLTGCSTKKGYLRAKRVLEQVPEKKMVIALGACALGGGIFMTPEKRRFDADVYVPGCPPKEEAIIEGIRKAVKLLEKK